MNMSLRAKKLACKTAAMICEEDMEAGLLKKRYGGLKEEGGPSVELIEQGMVTLIEELRHRGRVV